MTDYGDDEEPIDPEQIEANLSDFVRDADTLDGPPIAELTEQIADVVAAAFRQIEGIMEGLPSND